MDKKQVKGGYKVTQSNFLVEATHKTPFTLQEVRLLLTMVSMIEPKEKEFQTYTFSVSEFSEMLGMNEPKYHSIKSALHKLAAKTIELQDPDPNVKDLIITNWFDEIRYKKGAGQVAFIFHKKLQPFLLDLQRDFSTYKLQYVLILKSMYAIRLYELAKKWTNVQGGEFDYSLEELKSKLGATKTSYNTYGTFKQKVLLPSINEINEKTDVTVEFEELKEGRKVVGIQFAVRSKEKKKKAPKQLPQQPKQKPAQPTFGGKKKPIREELLPEWWDDHLKENNNFIDSLD